MKAKQHSFRCYILYITSLLILLTIGITTVSAQCPTVTNPSQSFCDIQSILVGDLQATDNGSGLVWYASATSTTPLSNSDSLVNGEDYFADDNTGTCGTRARVEVTIIGPPIGNNFQGVCLDDPSAATVNSLIATGNDVQWYITPSGGTPLNGTDVLNTNTIYYADQASPDGSCRTSRLSVLVIVGSTAIPTGDMVQNFCATASTVATVGDLVASGDNNWYISLFSAFPLPSNTPLINGQTYYGTSLDPPCESAGRLAVLAILDESPDPGENATLAICDNNFNSTFNLFDALGGSPEPGGTWTPTLNSGSDIFDPNTDAVGDYTYTLVSNNTCPGDSAVVSISIIPAPNAGTNGTVNLCSTSDSINLFDNLGGTPETGGVWTPTLASGTEIFNPAVDMAGVYTYTVNGIDPCANATATVTVSVTQFQDAGENGAIDICNNIGTINLFDSLGGTPDLGGVWSPELTSGSGIFDPLTDAPGIYTYSFTGNNPCPNESAEINVNVVPLPIAGSDGTLELCSNDLATVDLFDSLGDNPQSGGTWSPELNSGTGIFNPAIDNAGIYTYTLTGTPPCTDISAEVSVIIIQAPDAGISANVNICDNDGSIDLFETLGGSPEVGGTWTPALNSNTNIFDPLVDAVGTYTYTVLGTSPCENATATITISITPFQNAGLDGSITICNDNGSIDLFDSLGGTPEIGGEWTPILTSGTGIFDPLIDTAGIYTYTTAGTGPCSNDMATVNVSVEIAPNAGLNNTINICSNDGAINLFDNLNGTPDTGGTWSPALSSGTNIFDPLLDAIGDYTYTVTGTSPCANATSTMTVAVEPFQNAGTNGTLAICSDDGNIDLFDSLGGTPVSGGIWSPALNSGTGIFDPLIDNAATYTYTTSGTGPCTSDTATVEVSVEILADPGTNGTLNLCSLSDSSDLFNSLGGTPQLGGTWSPTLASSTGVFDASLDPEGIYTYTITSAICGNTSATVSVSVIDANDAGNSAVIELCANESALDLFDSLGGTPDTGGVWTPTLASGTGLFDPAIDNADTYTYTVSNSSNLCPDDTATITVSILNEPDTGGNATVNLCDSATTVDLFDSLTGTPEPNGFWQPLLTSGSGIFDPNTDAEGVYTYNLTNSCGTSSTAVTVSLSDINDAGINGTLEICDTDAAVDLFNSLGGTPDTGGTWTPALASGTGIYNPTVDAAGIYTYTLTSPNPDCTNDAATVTVSVLEEPDAGENGTLNLCNTTNTVDLFDALSGTPEPNGIWSPTLTSSTGIFDPSTDPEGTYTYTLSNSCGTNSATVTVSLSNINDAGTSGILEICNTDAAVDLFDSLGGTPDIGGTWTPELASGTGIFDPMVDLPNVYTYTLTSATPDCPDDTATITVSILQGPNAGENGTLNLCDSTNTVDLFDSLAGTPEPNGIWSPALTSGTGIFDPSADPEGVYTYTLSNSCGTNSATVTVSLSDINDAGTSGILEICTSDTAVDLFNSLGGTPDIGGIWTPELASGTGIFDPMVDAADTYTYTLASATNPCPDASATVTVSILELPNAGENGSLNICDSTDTVDLFDSLTGSPEPNGIWTPGLTSGTGEFDPTSDVAGNYTYTILNSCGVSSAEVTVTVTNVNDAGADGAIAFCTNDPATDLFNSLGGTPQAGGTWTPALTSGTGVFDPATDLADTYTYTISSVGSTCPDATANVIVTFTELPNAGTNGSVDICIDDTSEINLFDSLEGAPEAGGEWSPLLTSTTGVFNPSSDAAGIYTYTITNSCGTSSAEVTVTLSNPNDAGTDGAITFCSNDTATDLFNSLGGTPQTDGIWVPALASNTGIFDPMVDSAGVYTYLVSDTTGGCPDATASVEVTILALPNAGIDDTLNLCSNETDLVDLFDSLGGTPETGGVWSPTLASGTSVFDPNVDVADVYTYTVTSTTCNLTASSDLTVTILDIPDATGFEMTMENNFICFGEEDAVIDIINANQLPDGDYAIVYQLSEANTSVNTAAISVTGGSSAFTIPQALLQNPGVTIITINQLFVLGQSCSAVTDTIEPFKIVVQDPPTPEIFSDGTEFCIEDNATVADLTANISNNTDPNDVIVWYDQPIDGIAFSNSDDLQENVVYYGSIVTQNGCESAIRLEVNVTLISCIGSLVIPDGFSPNNDGINDTFDVLFLKDLHPNFKVSIYNRYGNILYEGDKDSPLWDGTWKNNNTILPVGVYFYIIEFNDGETEAVQGRVYLSR